MAASPYTYGMDPVQQNGNGQSWGAVIGILIIIAVILFGGVYFFFKQNPPAAPAPDTQYSPAA